MTVIGLTGNIACGKTSVAKILEQLGCYLIDADLVARKIVEQGKPAYAEIKNTFGNTYFKADGSLDRGKLGAYVFSNPKALDQLNAITHPAILEEIREKIRQQYAKESKQIIVVEAALLLEANMLGIVDKLWVVAADDEIRLKRLQLRDNLSQELALARMNSQMLQAEKIKRADYVIYNNLDVTSLIEETHKIWKDFIWDLLLE